MYYILSIICSSSLVYEYMPYLYILVFCTYIYIYVLDYLFSLVLDSSAQIVDLVYPLITPARWS